MQDFKVSDPSTELVSARLGTEPLVGTTLNERYCIESLIAAGGMGRVYRGMHTALLQPVAIKLLHSHLLTSPQAAERFFTEARAASKLRHPAIASVSDYGESESGEPYIVMDYIPGQPLSQKLHESGTLSAADCVRIAISVLSALNCCHAQNIIHRDLKPSNIILTDNPEDPFPAKLVDFGIAKLAREEGEAGRVTATGEIFGSPYYISPEQCQSNQIDGRTDIYALGCVLYECVSGQPPFSGRNLIEILMRQCSESAPPLLDLAPECPKYLSDIIHAMLEKSPDNRPATAEQVLSMIDKAEKLKGKTTPVLISKAEKNKSDARAKTETRVKADAITSSITRVKIALSLTAIVIAGSAAWLLPGTFNKPLDPPIDLMVRTLPPSAAQVDEVDALIERADTERMNGEFFEPDRALIWLIKSADISTLIRQMQSTIALL
ncbi:MAG: serine/threonine protein kinase [Candidatus Obscuribacter sp.]|nr:serine/threonine protein kinase [Candidatus Obscuribacter sp.]